MITIKIMNIVNNVNDERCERWKTGNGVWTGGDEASRVCGTGSNGLVTAVNGWFKLLSKAEGEFYNAPCTDDVEKALVELRKKFEARSSF